MLQTSLLLMKSLNKTETPFFYLLCILCFQRQSSTFLFTLFIYANVMVNRADPDQNPFFCGA